MFECLFEQASLLKKICEAIKELTDQACFEVSGTGISLQAMDSSHVSLVSFLLRNEHFSQFRCDRNLTLGLNLKMITKILKTAGNEDRVTLRAEDDGDHLVMVIESKTGNKISSYEVKMLDIDQQAFGVNETDYKASTKMSSEEFQRICHDLLVVGDTVSIEMTKDGITFSVSGTETSGCITCRQSGTVDDESVGTEITLQEPMNLSFALKFLNLFTKATPLSNSVSIEMSADQPLCIHYDIGDMGNIRYFLAPKIDDEEGAGAAGAPAAAPTEAAGGDDE
ncbi:putative Proliferating cell nuclear antigen [Paratrimastix pyriformis]|uniref:DNA sliding clamp PCNA n=1 Tax=Paratrimastix pyriformis TaxID=342808 RepID=A0ABQ8UY56_9EUKA|nr:putative Proliferating cell nuclear antigen [Paratrimastix pyriformis]